jgi:hypothetical protein
VSCAPHNCPTLSPSSLPLCPTLSPSSSALPPSPCPLLVPPLVDLHRPRVVCALVSSMPPLHLGVDRGWQARAEVTVNACSGASNRHGKRRKRLFSCLTHSRTLFTPADCQTRCTLPHPHHAIPSPEMHTHTHASFACLTHSRTLFTSADCRTRCILPHPLHAIPSPRHSHAHTRFVRFSHARSLALHIGFGGLAAHCLTHITLSHLPDIHTHMHAQLLARVPPVQPCKRLRIARVVCVRWRCHDGE